MGHVTLRLKSWLAEPLTRGLDLDDPRTTALRREILQRKEFLRRVYDEWYRRIAAAVPPGPGAILELGSGAGFLKSYLPDALTSDVFACPGVDRIVDAQALDFAPASLKAIVMIDVLHHLPQVRRFFAGAARCVRPTGAIVMVEPWPTTWSLFVYRHLHHEPFDVTAAQWEFPPSGPLSGANGALPWIIFARDRARFEREFPQWRVDVLEPLMPIRYLLSGGMSVRGLMPGWTFAAWRWAERALHPLMHWLAMFVLVVLTRTETAAGTAEENACEPH
jgi:SAM-dependent methyltransferase